MGHTLRGWSREAAKPYSKKGDILLQRMQDDEMGDEPLLEDFKVLRRRIFHWHGGLCDHA